MCTSIVTHFHCKHCAHFCAARRHDINRKGPFSASCSTSAPLPVRISRCFVILALVVDYLPMWMIWCASDFCVMKSCHVSVYFPNPIIKRIRAIGRSISVLTRGMSCQNARQQNVWGIRVNIRTSKYDKIFGWVFIQHVCNKIKVRRVFYVQRAGVSVIDWVRLNVPPNTL